MSRKPLIESETGALESVVVHTPGSEIESMTPRTAQEVLYNDIIPLKEVRDEHGKLKAFLETVCEVHEVTDLLAASLADPEGARVLIERSLFNTDAAGREEELLALPPAELARRLVHGMPSTADTLESVLSARQYDLKPIPNLYFMRDSSMVIGEDIVIGAMAHTVREREALMMRSVFSNAAVGFDGSTFRGPDATGPRPGATDVRLEGGDVLVASPELIIAGVSERTSSAALDALVTALVDRLQRPLSLLAVVLPATRSTIHLDMIFTLLGPETALVYEPLVVGPAAVPAYQLTIAPGSRPKISSYPTLLDALNAVGRTVQTVPCGGRDPVVREREQWLSAANAFAIGPDRIVAYDCNVATLEELDRAGFAVVPVDRFLGGSAGVDDYSKLVVATPGVNLARGGGGPRCMTLPLRRAGQ